MQDAKLPKTERDCNVCEDGTLRRDDYELVCDNCYYTPSDGPSTTIDEDPQYSFRRAVEARAYGDIDDRPRMVGGWPDAYWGEGEYEFSPESGFHSPL